MSNSHSSGVVSYQNYQQNNYETKTIKLRSPILHIGSQFSHLNRFEYVQTSSKVYLPNQELLAKKLYKKGGKFLQDYINAIQKNRSIEPLLKQAFGEDWQQAKSDDGTIIFPDSRPKWIQEEGQKITDLRPMIRNGIGELYIPGSSIKGAIRTAIAYHIIRHQKQYQVNSNYRVSEIEKKLKKKLSTGELKSKFKQKFLDDNLFMDELFTNFSLQYKTDDFQKTFEPKSQQNTDFLRALKISDSQPLIKKKIKLKNGKQVWRNVPVVSEVIVSSHFEDWNAKYRASIYAEVVYQARTEFTITLDTEMLSWFRHRQGMKIPFETIDELLNICQEFAQEQWDYEYDYWQSIRNKKHRSRNFDKNLDFDYIRDFYEPEKCPYSLRLGWGSGLTGTTIGLCLGDELRAIIRDSSGISAPGFEASKSRRTIVNSKGEIRYIPGWIKLNQK